MMILSKIPTEFPTIYPTLSFFECPEMCPGNPCNYHIDKRYDCTKYYIYGVASFCTTLLSIIHETLLFSLRQLRLVLQRW